MATFQNELGKDIVKQTLNKNGTSHIEDSSISNIDEFLVDSETSESMISEMMDEQTSEIPNSAKPQPQPQPEKQISEQPKQLPKQLPKQQTIQQTTQPEHPPAVQTKQPIRQLTVQPKSSLKPFPNRKMRHSNVQRQIRFDEQQVATFKNNENGVGDMEVACAAGVASMSMLPKETIFFCGGLICVGVGMYIYDNYISKREREDS